MKILPNLLTHCCIALLCLSLCSCSSHNKKFAHRAGVSGDGEEISASEPEESAGEELEALKGLSAKQKMTLEQAGIDASKYDFPIVLNDQVQYYLDLFQGKQRNYYTAWLARSTAYRPHIEAELKKAGLPRDLVFLAMIESGYNPSAYSPANACGLWQFIEGTGRTYGLKIDAWVDERRDPEKATQAAIAYLSKLHRQFDDWYLAVAAYNTGERRIDDISTSIGTKDFWEISATDSLYTETKRYVPKLIAAIIIGRDPKKYGFTDIDYQSPRQHEEISVPGNISLEAVANTGNIPIKELRLLNNELRKNQTPPNGRYSLKVPVGSKELIAANIDNLKPVSRTVYATHTVKKGDSLTSICKQYNISKTTLLKANNLRSASLKNGQRLQIPTTATQYVLAQQDKMPAADTAQKQKAGQQQARHQVQAKDTLASVARQYKVSVKDLLSWNNLSPNSTLKPGQKLALAAPAPAAPTVAAAPATPVKPTAAPVSLAATSTKTAKTSQPTKIAATAPQPTAPASAPASTQKMTPVTATAPPALAVAKKQSAAASTPATVSAPTAPTKPTLAMAPATKQPSKDKATAKAPPQPAQPTWYVVKNGDTLTTVAQKFNISPQDLRKLNKLSSNALQSGNKLLVKKG